jgi:ferrous iron transport protein B
MGMGKLLRITLFRGENAPFVMELPPYRLPVLKSTIIHMWEKGSVFLSRAGTVILAGSTLVWFLSHYPGISNRSWSAELHNQQAAVVALHLPPENQQSQLNALELAHESRVVNSSLAARFGKLMQPTLAPILDPDHTRPEAWKDTVALTAGFVAKEIVVSTMAVIHQAQAGDQTDGNEASALQSALKTRSGLAWLMAWLTVLGGHFLGYR